MILHQRQTGQVAPDWVMISQMEHARISGELAKAWNRSVYFPINDPAALIEGIFHHDDGWTEWEKSPDVLVPESRPQQFTEMPLAESLEMWRDSILAAAKFGPLPGLATSCHFMLLIGHSSRFVEDEQLHEIIAKRYSADSLETIFAASQFAELLSWKLRLDHRFADQLARWCAESSSLHFAENEGRLLGFLDEQSWWQTHYAQAYLQQSSASTADFLAAVECLRFFDALSLWLCVRERNEPVTMKTPDDQNVELIPETPHRIVVSPWPFAVSQLEIAITGKAIPIGNYVTQQMLTDVPKRDATIRWTLLPPGADS